ncbi:NADPH2:quinone reductase [Tamaricihabitans halophyticus]|uniref:NADPH2:quinone reductase n=1 Tax=Tamaricihabitans halophyticus TaxID=1262583 RepID=A0A4R2QXN2_9PSEU|nr:zinc-binding dehydrogenase [Tamaricihabitans halophyticus]TCP54952.1 NADPH2:quinone reductase [Tamaricihabitans halophyticus]
MQAVVVTRFGGPEVLQVQEVPEPVPGPGQVLVRVAAADVISLDTYLRGGFGSEYFGMQPPYVPGDGVSGTVVAIGDQVDPAWMEREVVATTGVQGGYAEFAVVSTDEMIAVPEGLTSAGAAALVHDGRTALALADAARITADTAVLVLAAGSGLGLLLVQLARAAGARVVAAAGGGDKLRRAVAAGAETAIDYTRLDWVAAAREAIGTHGAAVVFDGVGGQIGRDAIDLAARGGRFLAYGSAGGDHTEIVPAEAERRDIVVLGAEVAHVGGTDAARTFAGQALDLAAAGRIAPVVEHTFPLEQAAQAHAAMENRAVTGRPVLLTKAGTVTANSAG